MKNKYFIKWITLCIAVFFILSLSVFSAFAAPDEGGGEGGDPPYSDDGGQADSGDTDIPDSGSGDTDIDAGSDTDTDQGQDIDSGDTDEPGDTDTDGYSDDEPDDYNDYINGIYGDDSDYSEPEYLQDLPEVSDAEVQEATAVPMPDVAVSDATLTSGIIMWLCVAVGVSVVVGVMVSKRTRNSNAG